MASASLRAAFPEMFGGNEPAEPAPTPQWTATPTSPPPPKRFLPAFILAVVAIYLLHMALNWALGLGAAASSQSM